MFTCPRYPHVRCVSHTHTYPRHARQPRSRLAKAEELGGSECERGREHTLYMNMKGSLVVGSVWVTGRQQRTEGMYVARVPNLGPSTCDDRLLLPKSIRPRKPPSSASFGCAMNSFTALASQSRWPLPSHPAARRVRVALSRVSRFGLERSETKPSVWGEWSERAELP